VWRPSNPARLRHAIDGARHTDQDIADLLGHRSIETTFLYTKVDLERLRTLAAEWPRVKP
jgi:site-specific recombinase XerD